MPTISRLSVTPVKGLALAHPQVLHLGTDGVDGNRSFLLVDGAARRIPSQRHPALLTVRATYDPEAEHLRLDLPGGRAVAGAVRAGSRVQTRVFRRTVAGFEVEGPFSAALSELTGDTVRLVRVTSPGMANDVHPVSMLSEASVTALARTTGRDVIDARRFRMLIDLGGCRPHEEDSWSGRRVRVGDATVRVRESVGRCVVTHLHPDSGERDLDTLGAIREHRTATGGRALDFGVYASVEEPGTIRVGDRVTPE